MKVGVIGLGAMGLPIARNLLAAGHEVIVTSRSRPPIEAAIASGAVDGGDAQGVVRASEATILSVPFAPDVHQVLDAARPALTRDKLIVDCSTIDPAAEIEMHERVAAAGGRYLEAPVSGDPSVAQAGRLAIMTGGDAENLEIARPALAAFSRIIVHMGGPGSGQAAKMCNNLVHAAQNMAVAEATALALAADVEPARFREIVLHSTGNCTAMRDRFPVPGVEAYSPASNGWKGFPVWMMIEEMDMVLAFARQKQIPLASTSLYRGLLEKAEAAGFGGEDFSSVGKLYQDRGAHADTHVWLSEIIRRLSKANGERDTPAA